MGLENLVERTEATSEEVIKDTHVFLLRRAVKIEAVHPEHQVRTLEEFKPILPGLTLRAPND